MVKIKYWESKIISNSKVITKTKKERKIKKLKIHTRAKNCSNVGSTFSNAKPLLGSQPTWLTCLKSEGNPMSAFVSFCFFSFLLFLEEKLGIIHEETGAGVGAWASGSWLTGGGLLSWRGGCGNCERRFSITRIRKTLA